MCLDTDGRYLFVAEFLHVKPGKGPAFVRMKLRSATTGRIIDKAWNSGVKVEEVCMERRPHQYFYSGEMGYHFTHPETPDQIVINEDLIDGVRFFREGDMIETMIHVKSETVLTCELLAHTDLRIAHIEPGIKGDAVTNSLKFATIEAGARIRVSLFINQGDLVTADTRDGSYVGRIKE